jgi:hypothetical protein
MNPSAPDEQSPKQTDPTGDEAPQAKVAEAADGEPWHPAGSTAQPNKGQWKSWQECMRCVRLAVLLRARTNSTALQGTATWYIGRQIVRLPHQHKAATITTF